MDELRIGIVGAGHLATKRIYPCLHNLPVRLAGVCDLDRDKAASNARRFGGEQVFTDHMEMFEKGGLDAVIVCVGPDAHHKLAMEAMESGLPVYTEKPPAITAADARAVVEVSARTKRVCMTAFKKRFAPAYRKARDAIRDDSFGAPTLLSIDYASGPYPEDPANPRSWFLLDFAIHIIDLTRFLMGEVSEVTARTCGPHTYAVAIAFDSGAVGTLALSSHRDWAVSTEKVELTGGPGQFLSIENSTRLTRFSGSTIVDRHDPSFSTASADSLVETGFMGELEEFVLAVLEDRQPEPSITSGWKTMLLYEAIAESAATGGTVRVPNELPGSGTE